MLFQIKEKIRNLIIHFFMSKKNDIKKDASSDFLPKNYIKRNIANSSIITMYQNSEETLFFRECRRHKPMRRYLYECIEDYFDTICEREDKDELKKAVFDDLSKKENYKKIIRINSIFNQHLMEILGGVYCGYSETGLNCFSKLEDIQDFIAFIKYIQCAVISQKTNTYLKNGMYENFNANKQLATYHLACLLEIDSMIPAVWTCCFSDGEKERVGTMMEKAEGIPPSDVLPNDRKNFVKASFLRDITNLEYFDALCYQLDHRLDNYFVTKDEEVRFNHVIAFDNDAVRTFFVNPNLPKRTYAGATCVLDKSGAVTRPYMDKVFADKLLSLSKKDIKNAVGEYLSTSQLYALNQRVKKLQKAITRTVNKRDDFLVCDWEKVSVESACESKWGKTYFDLYLNDTLMLDRQNQFETMKNKS